MEQTPQPDVSFSEMYTPLARVVPFLRRPPRAVPSSLSAVEEYFGAELNERVIDAAVKLSERQLEEVQHAVARTRLPTATALALSDRRAISQSEEKRKPRWRMSKLERDIDRALDVPGEEPWAGREYILGADEIAIHEASLDLGAAGNPADAAALKYLALYCQHTAIRDPVYENTVLLYTRHRNNTQEANRHFTFQARRRRFADGLRQLLPIAPLVRSGAFILVPEDSLRDDPLRLSQKTDPVMAAIVDRYRPGLLQEIARLKQLSQERDNEDVAVIRQQFAKSEEAWRVAREHYPDHLPDDEWQRLITITRWTRDLSLMPVTSDPVLVRHLQQGTHLALDGGRAFRQEDPRIPEGEAISYRIPSLSEVSFKDLARLRESSAFGKVRTALVQLAVACAESHPRDYDAYKREVAERAADIVGPAYNQINRRRRAGRWARLGVTAASEIAGMKIDGVAGSLVAAAVDRLLGQPLDHLQRSRETACSILKSISLYK